MGRDEDLAGAFVALAQMLTGEHDLRDVMEEIVDRCATLVDAAAVGLMMVDDAGELRLSAASTDGMAELELLEMQRQEGPCYDAFRSGEQVNDTDLAESRQRWPRFAPRALELGYRATHAFPLRVRDERLGALNVFFPHAGPFSNGDLHALQALADVAAVGVLQHHMASRRRRSHEQAVLELSRIALEQTPLEEVYERVCATVTEMLDVPLCQIHELDPTGRLVPRVGIGWDPPLEQEDPTPWSPFGAAVSQRTTVVVEELAADDRFRTPALEEQRVVSGISSVIPGDPGPFGAISAYTHEKRPFDGDAVTFLGSVATLLGSVIARHRVEAQLRRAQRHEAVGQLATGIAHDFSNLLAVIHGNAELLAMDTPSEQVDAILTATDQGRRQVQRLLSFGRIQQPSITRLDLNETVRTTVAMVQQTIGSGVALELELAEDLPPIEADAAQLEQAIVNLVVNARDAMPEGGRITIATCERPERDDGPAATRFVRLVVTDTGVGMPEDVLARAFDPYFTTKAAGRGTGLGLAAVYSAVTAVQGRIDVDTEPGRGSSFILDLPSARRVSRTFQP